VSYLKLIGQCGDAFEATNALQENSVDLMFIDIQMPGLSGLQFVKTLAHKPMVIFLTAYKQYALDAYDLDVIDYLVKPVSLERFMKACNKAKEMQDLKLAKPKEAGHTKEYFFVNVDYKLLKITTADVAWIEGLKDYIKIHLKSSARPIVTRMSMKGIEEELPGGEFMRIHKSYIVSIAHITAVMKNSVFIGDLELPVGENYRDEIAALTGKTG